MKTKYEIQKVLVVSTGHITADDNNSLLHYPYNPQDLSHSLIVDSFEYGYNIYVNLDKNEPKIEDSPDWNYSDALKKLMQLARSLGCTYLKLDRDGETYDDLESFEW